MLTKEDKDFISAQFETVHQKIDLIIDPVKSDVAELKINCADHTTRIVTLENFKEGHQQSHASSESKRRFNWEMIASVLVGSGVIGFITIKVLSALTTVSTAV